MTEEKTCTCQKTKQRARGTTAPVVIPRADCPVHATHLERNRAYDEVFGRAVAACNDHALEALLHLTGRVARIRQVSEGDDLFRCHCGAGANWFLKEVTTT